MLKQKKLIFFYIIIIALMLTTALFCTTGCTEKINFKLENDILTLYGSGSLTNFWNEKLAIKEIKFSPKSKFTSFETGVFQNMENLEKIEIPKSIVEIKTDAFADCKNLNAVYYQGSALDWAKIKFTGKYSCPNTITGNIFFNNEKLEKLVVEDDVINEINDYAFSNIDTLEEINISTSKIGEEAFANCKNLKIVNLKNIFDIGQGAFLGCAKIEKTNYIEDKNTWGTISFRDKTSNPIYYSHILYINNNLAENIKINSNIYQYAFYNCKSLKSIEIGNESVDIGDSAFYNCENLINVNISNSLEQINQFAFFNCTNLKNINIGNNLQYIGDSAFYNCEQANINIPDDNKIKYFRKNCFYNCKKLKSFKFYEFTESIYEYAFSKCESLTEIDISNDDIEIEYSAFAECINLTKLSIPKIPPFRVLGYYFGNNTNENCESVYQGDKYYRIPKTLKTIILKNDKYVVDDCFFNCSMIENITIPKSVNSIGENAFKNCTNLKNIYYCGTIDDWVKIRKNSYIFNLGTKFFIDNNEITDIVLDSDKIENYSFANLTSLKSVKFTEKLVKIGKYAFTNCRLLDNINFEEAVNFTYMEWYCFSECKSLIEVDLSKCTKLVELGYNAFYNCSNLNNLILPPQLNNKNLTAQTRE